MAPTRWKLRGAIKAVYGVMGELKLKLHPDKTFIGRISHGFDFLGYWFLPEGLEIAPKTVVRFVERVSRLYEQGANFVRIRGICETLGKVGEEWGVCSRTESILHRIAFRSG